MVKYWDSTEVTALRKMIAEKKTYLLTLTNKFAYQKLQAEIMFLERDVLPMVLNYTSVLHSEFAKYAIKCFDLSISKGMNALVIYQPIELQYKDSPMIGVFNLMNQVNNGYEQNGTMEISFDNMDGFGIPPQCIDLNILLP